MLLQKLTDTPLDRILAAPQMIRDLLETLTLNTNHANEGVMLVLGPTGPMVGETTDDGRLVAVAENAHLVHRILRHLVLYKSDRGAADPF